MTVNSAEYRRASKAFARALSPHVRIILHLFLESVDSISMAERIRRLDYATLKPRGNRRVA